MHFFAEDFNKRIMTPELNEDEMRLLHKEALELYDLYFKPDAKHKIGVGDHIAQEIFKSKLFTYDLTVIADEGSSSNDVTHMWRFSYPLPFCHAKLAVLLSPSYIASQK